MHYSPLRYPGGKNKLAKFIGKICLDNGIDGHYVEPYAGGASVALYLLIKGIVEKITINDVDRSIYALWHSILNATDALCDLIANTDVNLENWHLAKKIRKNQCKEELLTLGFFTLFLNRTNRSGILNAGVIGGKSQQGKYKIDCRFNKTKLIEKIRLIASYRQNITLTHHDALQVIESIKYADNNARTIFYFDPPYYLKGKSLYLNHYKHDDHIVVSKAIKEIKDIHWIISYDDTEEIRKMYLEVKQHKYTFWHTAQSIKEGREILFFSEHLELPEVIMPLAS